ncbi:MAG: cytochrome ubiquinol oxidase subunit I [Gemmatimonadales bacterium]|nr:cytochrome ubiquinol oxidase subunit I [Gemmatimonadales bacterium]
MIENLDLSMVDWARAQFALTALYHWIFVPLTLGLTWLLAFYHSLYYRTGNEEWKRLTKFWMKLFAINFAIGVATGIILEFEFGTNWSNYSWMVGDIFGAPLAIEGLFAFFLEATFFAVMFFGWNRVSKKFHLVSTWMVAIGSNLSAVWILVANAWMQHPVGQEFNPESARFEMQSFSEVVFSPVAISKFTHTTSSSMLLASFFVISVSSWFLLRGRHKLMARRSILVAAVFALFSSVFVAFTGDEAAYEVAQNQPMKLAACEGLYVGENGTELVAVGMLNPGKEVGDDQDPFLFKLAVPGMLSLLANHSADSFVPGMQDLLDGNPQENVVGVTERMKKGKVALGALADFKEARKQDDKPAADAALVIFDQNMEHMGYGHLTDPKDAIPPLALTFYSFHLMVMLGGLFPLVAVVFLFLAWKDMLSRFRLVLFGGVIMYFLSMIAHWLGWIVAEVGRQPWAIQDLLPVTVARTNLTAGTVQTTFFMFLALFTILLIAEIRIMLKQISIGPEEG